MLIVINLFIFILVIVCCDVVEFVCIEFIFNVSSVVVMVFNENFVIFRLICFILKFFSFWFLLIEMNY